MHNGRVATQASAYRHVGFALPTEEKRQTAKAERQTTLAVEQVMPLTRKDYDILANAIKFSVDRESELHEHAKKVQREMTEQIASMLAL